jgi:ketosteroid isomerase-like protein
VAPAEILPGVSQENVEVARAMLAAWNRRDRETWLAACHPEIEWSSAILREVEGPESVHRGREAMSRFWDEWQRVWNLEIDVSETRDLGDTVVALATMRTTGRASGAEVDRPIGYVFEFEDGLIRHAKAYLTPREALDAVGLAQ